MPSDPELGAQTTRSRRLTAPVRAFLATQNSSAVILLAAAVLALAWANSPWSSGYDRLWHTEFAIRLGSRELDLDLRHWINDGLMAFFFFVAGLEIRRELDMGELRERRRVATPVLAAVGGMAAPALIYLAVNLGEPTARGWGIAMGTDTAIALGIVTIVGGRASNRVRTFLLTLVIVDDIVALLVIALAYTGDVSPEALAAAGVLFAVVLVLRQAGVRHGVPYFLAGSGVWLATLASGVHPTIAGVAVGVLATAYPPTTDDLQRAGNLWRMFREQPTPEYARTASRSLATAISPNERLQHLFHPWTAYVIVPLFVLANAGVRVDGDTLRQALSSPVTVGIVLGLVVGKPLGIVAVAWLVTRSRRGLPLSLPWPPLVGAATVAGIGFTVALLIADISFTGEDLEEAKLGVLAASILASIAAWVVFRAVDHLPARLATAGQGRMAAPLVDLAVPVDPEVDHIRGPLDARITLLEYGDFECPYCGEAEPVIRQVLDSLGDDLAFVFRHLPLVDVHEHAELAAEAAEAAGAQGRFWEMHDVLMANGIALTFDDLVGYAGQLDLDIERFAAELTSRRHALRVSRDVAGAEDSEVRGTPTFFVNGRRHYGPYDVASLTSALQLQLDGAPVRRGATVRPDGEGTWQS